jgi:RND family efflux transporter MFP subunit
LQLRRKALQNRGKDEGKAVLPVACALADEAGYPRRGVVDFVNNVVDPATGTLHMRTVLPNPDGLILPGMFVRVRLTLSEPYQGVLVPERAVTSDRGNKQVFVVTAANVVERRAVKVGPLEDGMRVVREGLTAGDNVVVSGVQRLRPGMTVTVKKAASPGQ